MKLGGVFVSLGLVLAACATHPPVQHPLGNTMAANNNLAATKPEPTNPTGSGQTTPTCKPPPAADYGFGAQIPAGTTLTVVGLSCEDAYYGSKDTIVGLTCTSVDPLNRNDGGYYGGGANCSDGQYYYFYGGAFAPSSSPPIVGTQTTTTPTNNTGTLPPMTKGTTFTVADIDSNDAYYQDRTKYIGLSCTATDDMNQNTPGLYGGPAHCSDGEDLYFYAVAVSNAGTAAAGPPPPQNTTAATSYGATLPKGTTFLVDALDPSDAYYKDAGKLVNLTCTATDTMKQSLSGFYTGDAKCSDGSEYYFYAVAMRNVKKP